MSEFSYNPERQQAAALDRLLNARVLLASSSAYRRDQLVKVGFKPDAISVEAMPEEEEARIQKILKKDHYGRGVSAEIAAAKVAFLAKKARPEEVVVGMDTLPIFFGHEPDGSTVFPVDYINKPENLADAEKIIAKIFGDIVKGYTHYLEITRAGGWSDDDFSFSDDYDDEDETNPAGWNHYMLTGNYRSATVRVETGVAIRFPGAQEIDSFVAAVTLMPRALYRIAQKTDTHVQEGQLKKIISDVVGQMGEQSLKITGGINWGDDRIRKILDIKEYRQFDATKRVEKGVYYGAPAEAIKDFLSHKIKTTSI